MAFKAGLELKLTEQPESPCPDIERVDKLTILGVDVNSNLTAADHVGGPASQKACWQRSVHNRVQARVTVDGKVSKHSRCDLDLSV